MRNGQTLIHEGVFTQTPYAFQVNVEPLPASYRGTKLFWTVVHGTETNRIKNYFKTKKEAITFARSDKCIPHSWGSDISIFWTPMKNAQIIEGKIVGEKSLWQMKQERI